MNNTYLAAANEVENGNVIVDSAECWNVTGVAYNSKHVTLTLVNARGEKRTRTVRKSESIRVCR